MGTDVLSRIAPVPPPALHTSTSIPPQCGDDVRIASRASARAETSQRGPMIVLRLAAVNLAMFREPFP